MATRQGLNATLSYTRGNATNAYRVRCSGIQFGTQMIAEESQARLRRAYYPHRVSTQQFAITVQLKGYAERKSLSNWLSDYATYALDPDVGGTDYPTMSVVVPSYEFTHRGVPLSGFEWGDHVGSMIFSPQIVFEAAYEPWDKTKPAVTHVENSWFAFQKDEAIQYFYPFGTQLSGDDAPKGSYDKPIYPGDFDNAPDTPDPVPTPTPPGRDPSGQPLPPSHLP
jgi:hypothetical protein